MKFLIQFVLVVSLNLFSGVSLAQNTHQGWSAEERESMYFGTQGSRMIPKSWFESLERSDGLPFSDIENLTSFGLIASPQETPSLLPIGLAIDRQDDRSLTYSKLRWYAEQGGRNNNAEPWVGLNCSACHTGSFEHDGKVTILDGAPSLFNFQSFVVSLNNTMEATISDAAKWKRFSAKVLNGKNNVTNETMLRKAFTNLLNWQKKTEAFNETKLQYGYGRVDAIGHILNKILMFNGANNQDGNEANAPVSYPFLWNMWRQDRVQWNGSVANSRIKIGNGSIEYGALGRNTGEVLGVFGDVKITKKRFLGGLAGYKSSVDVRNLMRMELLLQKLKAPAWPKSFPTIDEKLAKSGEKIFKKNCASCHLTPNLQESGKPTERMLLFTATPAKELTDIWMACNIHVYTGPTGLMKGTKDLTGKVLEDEAPVINMLGVAVKGTLLGSKGDLIKEVTNTIFGYEEIPEIKAADNQTDPRASDRETCLSAKDIPTLAYKARPLDGIWATAPYLHNGSVSSLYELLLPAEERLNKFWVGNKKFDTTKVGFVNSKPMNGNATEIRVRDNNGYPIDGNGNQGHEYGASDLTDENRMELIEFLKSL